MEVHMVGLKSGIMEFGIAALDGIDMTCWSAAKGMEFN